MKALDRFIRAWRVRVALRNCPDKLDNVYDIGCDDGYLLRKLEHISGRRDGIDPRATSGVVGAKSEISQGLFPAAVKESQLQGTYDAVFALAVFEHFTESDVRESASAIARMLAPGGRLIVTVPDPFVDRILDVLQFLRLIDGQALEEHHGFDPETLLGYFSASLRLVKRDAFQLGLNNVFVFERA